MLVFLGLRYVREDIRAMAVSGYDVETMPELEGRRRQRRLGEWILRVLPKEKGSVKE